MARCSACNLLCSVELDEIEEIDMEAEAGDDGNVTVRATDQLRLVQTSGCCGDEVADALEEVEDIEVEVTHADDCPAHPDFKAPEGVEPDAVEYTVEAEFEPTDWYQTTDRHGKLIKRMRYQKHLYGAEVTVTVTCDNCGGEGTGNATTAGVAGSWFEPLN